MKPLQTILKEAVKDPEAGCGEYKGATIRRNTKSIDKKNKVSGHEWTEPEWAAGYTVSDMRGIGCLEVFTTVAKAKDKIDFYAKFPVPEHPQSDREKAKAKKLGLTKESMDGDPSQCRSIEDWRKELTYIMDTHVAGAEDWRTLTAFNKDFDVFNEYVWKQADAAEADGFPGIAREMRALTL
jgi:hypothetical protein